MQRSRWFRGPASARRAASLARRPSSVSSAAAGQINITGSVQLPLLDPDTAPSDVPDYVQDAGAGG